MSISINNFLFNSVATATQHLQNPNIVTGVLLEEIPSDIGRTYQSYKRGGVLEGIERAIKEFSTGGVWLGGILVFNIGFNKLCELFHIPMDIDFNKETIERTAQYLMDKNKACQSNMDVKGLDKYLKWNLSDNKALNAGILAKRIKCAKTISTIAAIVIEGIIMGIVIPKWNQSLTRNRIKKKKSESAIIKKTSFDEFCSKTSKNKNISFTGNILNLIKNIPYATENNNTFRLIITDVPIISGRAATSRNKYEALENVVIDLGSIYFYNFCRGHVQKGLRWLTNKMPAMNSMAIKELVNQQDGTLIENAMKKALTNEQLSVKDLFENDELAHKIYEFSTFGKYGKLNRYVSDKTINNIDKEVFSYIKSMAEKIGYDGKNSFDLKKFISKAKLYNNLNGLYLLIGIGVSIYGLSTLLPKLAFKLTTLLTGKNEFTGIADFDDKKDVKKT